MIIHLGDAKQMLLKRMVVMKFHFFRKDYSHVLRDFITPLNYLFFKKIKIKKKNRIPFGFRHILRHRIRHRIEPNPLHHKSARESIRVVISEEINFPQYVTGVLDVGEIHSVAVRRVVNDPHVREIGIEDLVRVVVVVLGRQFLVEAELREQVFREIQLLFVVGKE